MKRLLLACALFLLGCEDTLPKATEIVHMRVLGSQVQVDDDPTRATPKPGEHASISLLTAFPKLTQNADDAVTMLIGCTAPTRFTGSTPICQEFLDVASNTSVANVADSLPMLNRRFHCSDLPVRYGQYGSISVQCLYGDPLGQLLVPADYKAKQVLLLGVVCERGEAYVDAKDPQLFNCEHNSGETTRINALVTIEQKPEDVNHNPDVDALTVRFDGGLWAPPPTLMGETQCKSSAQVESGPTTRKEDIGKDGQTLPARDPGDHVIDLIYDAAKRETDPQTMTPEDLEITVFDTLGKMERRFTLFAGTDEGKDKQLEESVKWAGPGLDAGITAGGKIARFFITLRDHRGGFSSTTRALCVTSMLP